MSKRLLVACEESQIVTMAFRNLGYEAFSCDIQDCTGGFPEFHIKDDVLKHLDDGWDMMIGFPPCTYLSTCQSQLIYLPGHVIRDEERYRKMEEASQFFYKLWDSDIPRICLENPRSLKAANLPVEYSQYIEPFFFGDSYRKRTRLFLKNLPPLMFTCLCEPEYSKWSKYSDSVNRSKFHYGVAKAMAEQWSVFLND